MRKKSTMGAAYFEGLYRADPDPWRFETSEYEDQKYRATLAALTIHHYSSALEVGCSIGVLTERLAPRCHTLHAVDLSPTAVAAAAARCLPLHNVRISLGAAPNDLPTGAFDLIVLSEILYYLMPPDLLALAQWCRRSATPGAQIILCHWLGLTDYPLSGEQASLLFVEAMRPDLEAHALLHSEVYRLERLQMRANAGKL